MSRSHQKLRIIVLALQIIEICFKIIIVAAVSYRIIDAQSVCVKPRSGEHISPCVIGILDHYSSINTANLYDVTLQILHKVILCSVIDKLSSFYHRYFGGCCANDSTTAHSFFLQIHRNYMQRLPSISVYFMILDILFSNYLYPDILEKKDCHPTLQV